MQIEYQSDSIQIPSDCDVPESKNSLITAQGTVYAIDVQVYTADDMVRSIFIHSAESMASDTHN